MATAVKRLLVGRALRNSQAIHERLTKKTALAVFSSDALSSTAYATEEILLVLAVAAAATSGTSLQYVIPISIGIAVLLAIVRPVIARRFMLTRRVAEHTSSQRRILAPHPDWLQALRCSSREA
jgi:hypothetical protein